MDGNVIGLYQPGDKVRVKMRKYTGKGMTTYTGLIEFIHDRFVTVHNGKYRVTVSTADLRCGDASIELIKRGGSQRGRKAYGKKIS